MVDAVGLEVEVVVVAAVVAELEMASLGIAAVVVGRAWCIGIVLVGRLSPQRNVSWMSPAR